MSFSFILTVAHGCTDYGLNLFLNHNWPHRMEIFLHAETWLALLTLTFFEIILGVDNIIFISIVANGAGWIRPHPQSLALCRHGRAHYLIAGHKGNWLYGTPVYAGDITRIPLPIHSRRTSL